MDNSEINVVKRDGTTEEVSFDKILKRIKKIGTEKQLTINYVPLAIKVIEQMYNGISTSKLDELTADQCASMSTIHYDYSILASRLLISNLHQNTLDSFYETMKKLYFNKVNDILIKQGKIGINWHIKNLEELSQQNHIKTTSHPRNNCGELVPVILDQLPSLISHQTAKS